MRNVSSRTVCLCLAGSAVVAATSATYAQDDGNRSDCGILCLFSSRPAVLSAETVPAAPQANKTDATPTPDPAANGTKAQAKARLPKPIVIAADAPEGDRLAPLTSIMPKQAVKIIDAKDSGSRADFSMSTTIDQRDGPAKVKLFAEQMYIVAGATIHSVSDLNGKVVSFGNERSTSQRAARRAFAALGISVNETPLDLDNALDGLASDDIAAVVLVSPRPDERLKRVAAPGLHLVAWPEDGSLPDGAVYSSIDGSDYPALAKPGEAIRALACDAVLTLNPEDASRPSDRKFLAALSHHAARLSKRGFDLLKADQDRRIVSVERR